MLYNAEQGNISIAVGGDAMITRRMSPHTENDFLKLVEILRNADVSIVNLEMLFHDYESSWEFSGGTYTRSAPSNLEELKWMGIDVVSTATNHAYDFSEGGFLTTLEHLRDFELPQAGGGTNMDEARAPAYFDSVQGRVALLNATSTFSEQSRAGLGRPDFPGKPGVNAIRHNITHHVERNVFDALHKANQELGYNDREEAGHRFGFSGVTQRPDPTSEVNFMGTRFLLGEEFSLNTGVNKEDVDGISKWIRGAGKQADWVIYTTHCHEMGTTGEFHGGSRSSPPEFLVDFARWTIDQGCALFASHGPHFLKGIEIYKGKPIFYSLGNFIFQNETVPWVPDESYRRFQLGYDDTPGDYLDTRSGSGTRAFAGDSIFWRSAIAVCDYKGGDLKEVRLYPIDLGHGKPIPQRGRPVLARGNVAREILEWLQQTSEPFGTDIQIEGDIGVIRL